jgi:hypothetical protein
MRWNTNTDVLMWGLNIGDTASNNKAPIMLTVEEKNVNYLGYKIIDQLQVAVQSISSGGLIACSKLSVTGVGEILSLTHFTLSKSLYVAGYVTVTTLVSRLYILDDMTLAITQARTFTPANKLTAILIVDSSWIFIGGIITTPNQVAFIEKVDPDLSQNDNPWLVMSTATDTIAAHVSTLTVGPSAGYKSIYPIPQGDDSFAATTQKI